MNLVGNLRGKFARGGEDQHLRGALRRIDALDGRNAEGRGLAGTGLRLADDIFSGGDQRDRSRLDGGRFLKSQLGDRFEKFGGNSQRREGNVAGTGGRIGRQGSLGLGHQKVTFVEGGKRAGNSVYSAGRCLGRGQGPRLARSATLVALRGWQASAADVHFQKRG